MWRAALRFTGLGVVLLAALAFGTASNATAERARNQASRLPDGELWALASTGRVPALGPHLARLRAAGINTLVVPRGTSSRQLRVAARRHRLELLVPVADRPGACRWKTKESPCAVAARSLGSASRLARDATVDVVVVRVRHPGTVAALHGPPYATRILALVPVGTGSGRGGRAWLRAIRAAQRDASVDLGVVMPRNRGRALDSFLGQLRRRKGVDLQAPSRPTPVLAATSETSVSLSWTAARDNVRVTGYRLRRGGVVVGRTGARGHSFLNLACGRAYVFGIQAVDAAGNVSPVAWLPSKTNACGVPDAPGTPPPPPGPLPPPPAPPPSGPAFYVSGSGSDGNPGTLARPWRTVEKAIDVMQPGQLAYVRTGSYGQTRCRSGDGGSATGGYVTVKAYPGERPVLSGPYDGILNVSCSYLRVQGFLIHGPSVVGGTNVYANAGSHHVEISDTEIRNSVCQGIGIEPSAHHWALLRNRIHDNGHGCDQQAHGVYLQGEDHVVANNVIYNQAEGYGIQAYPNGHRNLIAHNTIVGSGRGGIVLGGGNYDQAKVVNNVLAFNGGYGLHWNASKPTNCLVARNLVYGNQAGGIEPGAPASCSIGDIVTGSPLFVDLASFDLHALPGSATIDAADPAYTHGPDHDGTPRPQGAAPDIGAYER